MQNKYKEQGQFALGVLICFAVAAVAVVLEELIPGGMLGASIIALFLGTIPTAFSIPSGSSPL